MEITEVNKKRNEISWGDQKKKTCGISMEFWCLALGIPMGVTQ